LLLVEEDWARFARGGPVEGTGLKPFCTDQKPRPVKEENLEPVAPPLAKGKNVAAQGALGQLIADQGDERIEALT